MLLDLYFHHQNSAPRSGISRLWLIEYYTREWELKREKLRTEKPSAPFAKARKPSKKLILAKVEKAERDLEVMIQGVADIDAAQRFAQAVIQHAQRKPAPGLDFLQIAQDYRQRMREDDYELLLLSFSI